MESPYAPLSEACAKTLWDKTYEKRKIAAAEIEKYDERFSGRSSIHDHAFGIYLATFLFLILSRMVMEFNSTKNHKQIQKLIGVLGKDFAVSKDSNKRKGGLLGLAATSIGLGKVFLT